MYMLHVDFIVNGYHGSYQNGRYDVCDVKSHTFMNNFTKLSQRNNRDN